MANNMTGGFDAVVQLAVRQIDGVLATLHQNGANPDATLKLLHSASVRVGDGRPHHPLDVDVFGEWVLEHQTSRPPIDSHDLRTQLVTAAPPGVSRRLEAAFDQLGEIFIPPEVVRGRVKLQLASATLSVPTGSTSEVTIHVHVRGHYAPDLNTTDMPAPIHGEVQAVFEVRKVDTTTGRRLLIKPSSQDAKIQFIAAPGSGLSAGDAGKIATQVRKALRESFTLVPVDLPADFPFAEFKGVGGGSGQAVALPLQLSQNAPPPGGIQSITTSFVGTAGFAFGIGKEFVRSVFQPTIDNLLQFKQDFTISVPIWWDPTYHYSVTGVELQFNERNIDLIVRGKATTSNFGWPNYNNIVVKQRFALLMLFDTLFIQAGDYEPEVSGVSSRAVGAIKSAVIAQRNQALPPAQTALNEQLRGAKTRLDRALRLFGPSASASCRAGFSEDSAASTSGGIAITPDGVVIRGDVRTGTIPMAPIVEIAPIEPGKTYSALNSWIPGGRIDRMIWSWVEQSPIVAWGGVVKEHADEHRFILSIPPFQHGHGPFGSVVGSVCLRLEGTRILPDGSTQSVVAGTTCMVPAPEVMMDAPAWWEPVMLPIWQPGPTREGTAKDAIAGHITVQSDSTATQALSHNSLVYFADWQSHSPIDVLAAALGQMHRKSISLAAVIVAPVGTFDGRRADIEAKLASLRDKFAVPLQLTEDHEGGWTRTFAVSKVPSVYLINARREFVWSYEGEPEAKELAAALDRHLTAAPIPMPQPLRLGVAIGDAAPDALFNESRGEQLALHRMRGQRVMLTFWQSWSEPCLKELSRLQQLHAGGGKDVPLIVGFHGGKDEKSIETIRKQLGLTFLLVHDGEHQVARKYGVRCWPTTVSIGAHGHVEHVQFGLAAEHHSRYERAEHASA